MNLNYKAWDLNIDNLFSLSRENDKLRHLIKFAVLAPSSHNSQPWYFRVKDNLIEVFIDNRRILPESDKDNRQAFISIGCAIENILIASNYYGYSHLVNFIDYGNHVANIVLKRDKLIGTKESHLIFSIPKRVTNRSKYLNKMPPQSVLNEIKSLETEDLNIHIVTDMYTKNLLADAVLKASIEAMDSKDFRVELSNYIKSNITKDKIGMPGFGLGIPFPVSMIAPFLVKYLNLNKLSHKKDKDLLENNTPVFIIVATESDDLKSWVKTGQIYQKIALRGVQKGLSTSMWAAPIQIGNYYKNFQNILQTEFRPQAFFRLGYATRNIKHSPRICSEEVIK